MPKILIIEDDPVMVRMYTPVFEYEGFEVFSAADGLKGLAAARAHMPDIILLDIMMPQMSGLQVLDALKADMTTQAIPVIVFTNLTGRQDLDQVLAKGAAGVITKAELIPQQIVDLVKEELNRKQL